MDTAVLVVTERQGAVIFRVRVTPRAKRTEIIGAMQGVLRVKLAAPPVEGAANEALVKFLAAQLGVRVAQVEILSGHTARVKTVRVEGVTVADVYRCLQS